MTQTINERTGATGGPTRRTPKIRVAGGAAMLGGALWVTGVVVHALRPEGCVGEECATRAMRESGLLEGALATTSSLLILIGLAGLVLLTRERGRLTRTARAGVTLGVTGVGVLVAAGVVNEVVFDGDFAQMPYAVLPGMAALIVGFALVGAAVLRAQVLPRWIGAGLVLGALAMVGSNEQTAQVLLMVPFGLAWVAAGRSLLRRN